MKFVRASKKQMRLRMALLGPSGSGKTYSALSIGTRLGERVAVIDTEHGSASKYGDVFAFDALELDSFAPATYVEAIQAADAEGYDVIVVDSLSHAWMGKDGALEQVDKAAKRSGGNSFAGWRDVTPMHNAMIEAMLACKAHLIVTMRVKMEYVLEEDARGKKVPRRVGLQPVQRDGLEYEFDIVADLNHNNDLIIGKTRCSGLNGAIFPRPAEDVASVLRAWLGEGEMPEYVKLRAEIEALIPRLAEPEKAKKYLRETAGRDVEKLRKMLAQCHTRLASPKPPDVEMREPGQDG